MKKFIIFISIVFAAQYLSAQDEAIFAHYHINRTLVNPAFAGSNNNHEVFLHARAQWTGFPGAPKTYALSYNGAFGKKFGLGAMAFSDNAASLSRTKIALNYAFKYKIRKFDMSLGMGVDFRNTSVTGSIPLAEGGDRLLGDAIDGIGDFDATLGIAAIYNKETFISLAFPNLVSSRKGDVSAGDNDSKLFDFFMFNIGHKFAVDDNSFTITPSILVRRVRTAPFTADFNIIAGFLNEMLQTGLSYRAGTGGALGLLLGTKFKNVSVFYSYDVAFQGFQTYNSGTHELTIGFGFAKKDEGDRAKDFR